MQNQQIKKSLLALIAVSCLFIAPRYTRAALTFGSNTITSNGALTLDGAASSTYLFGSSTTTGTITIGGTSQTGNITLGSSDASNNILIGNGSGATTIVMGAGSASSKIGIGTATANNRLTVSGNADFSGNVALAGSSVSASRVINIDITGALSTGTTGVFSKINTSTAQDAIGGWFDVTTTGPGNNSASLVGAVMRVTDNSSGMGGSTINAEGINVSVTAGSGSSTNSNALLQGTITQSGYTNTLYGGNFNLVNHASIPGGIPVNASLANDTGTLSTGALFRGVATNSSSGTITNLYGLLLNSWTNSATVTASYGIYMDTSIDVGATSRYAIFSSSTSKSYLQGSLGLGTADPNAKLEIKDGHIASSQTTPPAASVTGTGYSGASMIAGSTDTKGAITATVGAAAGTLVVTFNAAYTSAPICTASPATATAQVDVTKMYVTASTSALTLNFVATPTGGSETWNYICMQ